jgi:uncharacterized repeat protein (TIGR02543 family)
MSNLRNRSHTPDGVQHDVLDEMKLKYQNQKSKLNVLFFTRAFFLSFVAVGLVNPPTANAQDTSSLQGNGMGLLENEWIKVGVNKDRGTFGSGHLTSPGILFDPTGSGNFDTTYDYLSHINDTNNINTTSNIPHDGFALKVDGTNKTNNNQTHFMCPILGGAWCTNDITGSTSFVDGTNELTWTGSVTVGGGTWTVKNTYSLLPGQKFIQIQTSITAGSNASTVYFAKYTDPDPSGVPNDAFSSDNKLGHAGIASTQIAFAQATVSGYAIGLYSAESNVNAGIDLNIDWVANPVTQADKFNDVLSNDYPGNGDDALGLTFTFSDLVSGTVETFCHAYVFGTDVDDAVSGSACISTLTYNLQSGTGELADATDAPEENVVVSSTVPTREGYTFEGWNTAADGSGTDYSDGDDYPLPTTGTDTLYAQWTAVPVNSVTLTYNLQGGSGELADATGAPESNVEVSSTVPTRDGYSFTGWDVAADGSGTDYSGGDPYTLSNSGTDTLYAQWAPVVVSVTSATLTYDPQGGSGEPDDQMGNAASDVIVPTKVPTRRAYRFAGWNTAADGSGMDCVSDDTVTLPNSGTITLYAQWTPSATTGAEPPISVPSLPALFLLLTSLLIAALGIKRLG